MSEGRGLKKEPHDVPEDRTVEVEYTTWTVPELCGLSHCDELERPTLRDSGPTKPDTTVTLHLKPIVHPGHFQRRYFRAFYCCPVCGRRTEYRCYGRQTYRNR